VDGGDYHGTSLGSGTLSLWGIGSTVSLQVGDRFIHYEVTDPKDVGEWEVTRVTENSAVS
jgi:hypothetical protein